MIKFIRKFLTVFKKYKTEIDESVRFGGFFRNYF